MPTLAGICLGFGIYTVFLQAVNYIIDAYLVFAASAVAANTVVRSIFGAIFPLWASYMFDGKLFLQHTATSAQELLTLTDAPGLGIRYSMTFLGCFAALFMPMPFILYRYGDRIRARSKFAPTPQVDKEGGRTEDASTNV